MVLTALHAQALHSLGSALWPSKQSAILVRCTYMAVLLYSASRPSSLEATTSEITCNLFVGCDAEDQDGSMMLGGNRYIQ